jgi:hypothetical protein
MRRQAGITFIGWLFLLAPVAIVAYAGIRLTPVYLNYMKVTKALKQTAGEHVDESPLNVGAVRKSLDKRFDIDSINYPALNDVVVARTGDAWSISVDYEDAVPLFGGISLLVHFEKSVPVE